MYLRLFAEFYYKRNGLARDLVFWDGTAFLDKMGIRLALGATKGDIVRLILTAGARPIAFGLAAGAATALIASRALQQVLGRAPIDARDPVAYAAMATLLTLIALAAMLGPARRAAAVDPVFALRQAEIAGVVVVRTFRSAVAGRPEGLHY